MLLNLSIFKKEINLKKEIASIYYVRVFAMLMVVFVHATAQYRHLFTVNTIQHQIYHFLNNIVRVESGIFIMLVGIVFFYNYQNRNFLSKENLLTYFKRRVVYILIPYIIWSLIYEADAIYYGDRVYDLAGIIDRILTGQSKYQLYFIFLIVQFYLVLPIIVTITQKSAFLRKYLWVFGVLIEFIYFFLNMKYNLTTVPFFLNLFGSFLLGAWIGLHYNTIKAKITNAKIVLAGTGFLLTGVPYVLIRYQNTFNERVPIPESLYKLLGIGFLVIGSFFFFYLCEKFVETFSKKTTARIKSIAFYSFGFYLLHPFVLYYVMEWLPTRETNLSWHVTITLQYLLTVIACYFIIWAFHRFVPFASFLFGKLPKKAYLFWQAGREVDSKPVPHNQSN